MVSVRAPCPGQHIPEDIGAWCGILLGSDAFMICADVDR